MECWYLVKYIGSWVLVLKSSFECTHIPQLCPVLSVTKKSAGKGGHIVKK